MTVLFSAFFHDLSMASCQGEGAQLLQRLDKLQRQDLLPLPFDVALSVEMSDVWWQGQST